MKKFILLLMVLPLMVACGKTKTKTVETTEKINTEALTATGISLKAAETTQGLAVGITCEDGIATNQQRLDELKNFKNSIGIGDQKTLHYYIGGHQVPTYKMEKILNEAIDYLKSSNLIDSNCPNKVLSATFI